MLYLHFTHALLILYSTSGTLTGSIGVVGGKFVVGSFLKDVLGVNVGVVTRGIKKLFFCKALLRHYSGLKFWRACWCCHARYQDFFLVRPY
jgi:hypothetical protein